MTQRQRAIEIVKNWAIECTKQLYIQAAPSPESIERATDYLLASDFCSDSVRELVKKLYDKWRGVPLITLGLGGKEIELLRKIVED